MVPGNTGFKRVIKAFFCSLQGLRGCMRTEAAFRQELALCALLFPLSFFVAHSRLEWLLLVGSLFLVLIVELLNTAVERAIDRISLERHELSRDAKDMGSAAVLLSLCLCALCWVAVIL